MKTLFSVASIVLCSQVLSACGGGWAMAAPADVVGVSDELPITNRSAFAGALADESFGLGSYRISDVDRKWNSTRSASFFAFEASRTRGGYGYNVSAGAEKLEAGCATEEHENSQDLGAGASFSKLVAKLGCSCRDATGEASLTLDASTTEQFTGTLKGSDYSYRITALTDRENGRMKSRDPLGYRVDGDGPVGAVGVVKPGRVWLNKSLSERTRLELACLFSGLLLYMPPKER